MIDAASDSPTVQGVRRFLERLAAEPRVSATAIQTVGGKGYDGFAIALVTSRLVAASRPRTTRRIGTARVAAHILPLPLAKPGDSGTHPRHGAASVPPALGTAGGNPAARLVDRRGREPCVSARQLALPRLFSAGCRLPCRSSPSRLRARRRSLRRGKPRRRRCRSLPHPPPTRLRASPAPKPNAPGFTSSRAPRSTPLPSRAPGDCSSTMGWISSSRSCRHSATRSTFTSM